MSCSDGFLVLTDALLSMGVRVRQGSALEEAQVQLVLQGEYLEAGGRSLGADLAAVTSSEFLWHRHPILADDDEGEEYEAPDVTPLRRIGRRDGVGRAVADSLKRRRARDKIVCPGACWRMRSIRTSV